MRWRSIWYGCRNYSTPVSAAWPAVARAVAMLNGGASYLTAWLGRGGRANKPPCYLTGVGHMATHRRHFQHPARPE